LIKLAYYLLADTMVLIQYNMFITILMRSQINIVLSILSLYQYLENERRNSTTWAIYQYLTFKKTLRYIADIVYYHKL
jgi:hypothetical protein